MTRQETRDLENTYWVLEEEYAKLLQIARDLAAKHVRGNACTYCGSAYNANGAMEHNPGCKVKALEAYV